MHSKHSCRLAGFLCVHSLLFLQQRGTSTIALTEVYKSDTFTYILWGCSHFTCHSRLSLRCRPRWRRPGRAGAWLRTSSRKLAWPAVEAAATTAAWCHTPPLTASACPPSTPGPPPSPGVQAAEAWRWGRRTTAPPSQQATCWGTCPMTQRPATPSRSRPGGAIATRLPVRSKPPKETMMPEDVKPLLPRPAKQKRQAAPRPSQG